MLLLYVASELPVGERAEVERMLGDDPAMRDMLEQLRASQERIAAGLARLDELQPLPAADVVGRRVGRAMRQWQTDRLSRPALPDDGPRPHFGWRGYVTAAASVAAVITLVMLWVKKIDEGPPHSQGGAAIARNDDTDPATQPGAAPGTASGERPTVARAPTDDEQRIATYIAARAMDLTFEDDALADAERQLGGLRTLTGGDTQ